MARRNVAMARPGLPARSRRVLVKVIIETCYLTDSEKEIASRLVRDAGAEFVKTSTGTGPAGATAPKISRGSFAGPSAQALA